MYIVLGATGHVGSAVAQALVTRGEKVTIVTRDPAKAHDWKARGVEVAVQDIRDVAALRRVFRRGRRLFLLNPPAPPQSDTDAVERASVAALVAALEGSGLEKVVAQSVYGAQPGERIGDLGGLHALEQALLAQPIPSSVVRASYFMSNWDMALTSAREAGVVTSFFPADFELPMVAPRDIAELAAQLLTGAAHGGIHHIEGPEPYTPADVAAAYAAALGRPVTAEVVPRSGWLQAFAEAGFSEPAAESYAGMTALTLDARVPKPASPVHGPTSLTRYIAELVGASRASAEGTPTTRRA